MSNQLPLSVRAGFPRPRSGFPLSVSLLAAAGAALALAGSAHQAQAQGSPAARSQGAPAALAQQPYQAWTQVPEYVVRYESSFKKSFSIPWEWHGSVHDYVMDMKSTATGKIQFQSSNGRYWSYQGQLEASGTYAMDENWYTPKTGLGVTTERASGPDYLGGMWFSLTIDTETGTYTIAATDVGLHGTSTFTDEDGSYTHNTHMQIPSPYMPDEPLPSQRPPLSFDRAIPISAPPSWRLADPYTADMSVKISIAPVGPKPEFILKPVNPKWIPSPNATLAAQVVPKKGNQTPAPIRFILEEITQEPGKCLNSPETDTDPDLEFDLAGGFEAPQKVGANSYVMESDGPVNGGAIDIRAKDYGAWGKLRAEAQIDGAWEPIPIEKSTQGFLTVPVDTEANKVADEYERKNKVKRAAEWDAEVLPTLNGTTGDGFSYYEEYRGMLVGGQHQRLDPNTKELVVENQAGGAAKPGISLLGAASKLKVLVLNPGELREDRVANANSTLARTRNQHGLRLKNVPLPEGTLGQALPVGDTGKRPATCTEVQIDLAQIQALPSPIPVSEELNNTVAHELAHGIGAGHHGEGAAPLIERFLTSGHQAPLHIVYGSDRKVITDRPFQIQGRIGGLGSLASGDEGCIMCYNSFYQWAVQRTSQGEFRYYAQQYRRPGTRFCTSRNGTGVNSPKNKPAPFFGHAERGNCLAQLCPKDS